MSEHKLVNFYNETVALKGFRNCWHFVLALNLEFGNPVGFRKRDEFTKGLDVAQGIRNDESVAFSGPSGRVIVFLLCRKAGAFRPENEKWREMMNGSCYKTIIQNGRMAWNKKSEK